MCGKKIAVRPVAVVYQRRRMGFTAEQEYSARDVAQILVVGLHARLPKVKQKV
jgi:molecular chaperone DnaK (HSP70)